METDEIPELESLETPYGKFRADWKPSTGVVNVSRALEIQSQVIPPTDYKKVREFLLRFNGTEAGRLC